MAQTTQVAKSLIEIEDVEVVNPRRYQKIVLQRRFMAVGTAGTLLAVVLFIAAISTAMWAVVEIQTPAKNTTVTVHLGIWGEWRTDRNKSRTTTVWISHFPQPADELIRLGDVDLPHYYRTQAVFSAIVLFLMLIGNALAIYCFFQHRYVYKRLTAGLFGFVALCIVVIIEVLDYSIGEWNKLKSETNQAIKSKSERQKASYMSSRTLGYSSILAWVVFALYLAAAVIFFVASRKHKGSRAATQEFEEEDRPVNIGR